METRFRDGKEREASTVFGIGAGIEVQRSEKGFLLRSGAIALPTGVCSRI